MRRQRSAWNRTAVFSSSRGSTVNHDEATGFWVRYDERNTELRIGRDGASDPVVEMQLWDQQLTSYLRNPLHNSTNEPIMRRGRDDYGWFADEVIHHERRFVPRFVAFDIQSQGAAVDVGYDCSNVLFRTYGQEQADVGGSCFYSRQCPKEHNCRLEQGNRELRWRDRRVCTAREQYFMEKNWIVVIVVVILGFLLASAGVTVLLYRRNNNNRRTMESRLKRALFPTKSLDALSETVESDQDTIKMPLQRERMRKMLRETHDPRVNDDTDLAA